MLEWVKIEFWYAQRHNNSAINWCPAYIDRVSGSNVRIEQNKNPEFPTQEKFGTNHDIN